jgi:hypothetical protein
MITTRPKALISFLILLSSALDSNIAHALESRFQFGYSVESQSRPSLTKGLSGSETCLDVLLPPISETSNFALGLRTLGQGSTHGLRQYTRLFAGLLMEWNISKFQSNLQLTLGRFTQTATAAEPSVHQSSGNALMLSVLKNLYRSPSGNASFSWLFFYLSPLSSQNIVGLISPSSQKMVTPTAFSSRGIGFSATFRTPKS